ncbi:antibiotic biosynthesis monooxygenase [Nostoc sp. FACHB-973]|uniref:Antibiotic biosynthesis monooxygenase n=1 Tax=Desmonostoc muscorum LEGE 12446 TaxID=1828758 RepID=A0A8J6ZIN3_DESMC|nr:antibiotic biosynthesis monooxygenase [Desmonostoc muscorum]MBD2516021.1 antibiotic biosynthesis monooxygenase [Nostoc sp. FACHB-973]MBX9258453.1 antibiotic biosynthesis monooxygenase [Desmonostoc muscorum CCALA 125]MCF2147577.1 antibiotic biosynthesis monooxygenase [Desmonostoc muscorum LEGE 12446]
MITFVNIFTVNHGKQEDAFQRIHQIYTEVVQSQPGFLDAQLLKSDDGSKIAAIAHWESAAQIDALRQHPRFQQLHDEVFYEAIAKVEPHVYSSAFEVVAV